ncbi:MAG: hypothetical protein C4554_10880 [Dethiobacter sp.]|nr:MAG: hypothetical protein C4554_10880 [Dethiobacter sp.]
MNKAKPRKCPRCGYIFSGEQLVRCPRCNMNLLEKCMDCDGCSSSLWERGKQTCTDMEEK